MTKNRIVYFDVLNIFAAISVILLHCNGIAHTYSNTTAWKQALGMEVLFYWAVPIFFMLTGATLMGYREKYSTKQFFKKRLLRTALPFIIWSVINACIKRINPFEIGAKEFISRIFLSQIENVYWFFIPLFSIYLAMPILSLLKDNKKILWYMAGGAFFLTSLFPPLFDLVGVKWNFSLSMLTMGGYLLFPVLGYLLSTTEFSRKQRWGIYVLGVFGALLRYGVTFHLSTRDGIINKTFFSYTGFYSVFLACAVFVFFKHSGICKRIAENQTVAGLFSKLAGCSFGVYLIHMIILRLLGKIIPQNCWEWRLLVPFLIYIICLVIVLAVKKIPIVKWIFP